VAAVWLITGAQASGKSTVADLLAGQFERAVHIRGAQFYRWAVRGWVHFDAADQAEARRLLALRYRLAALTASEYAAAGFTAVVQDNIYGADVSAWIDAMVADAVHVVVLRPSVSVVEARHEQRRKETGKVAYRDGYTAALNDADLAKTPRIGLWLDTSFQSPIETVKEILARASDARVR
jgi:cytidylate kinase